MKISVHIGLHKTGTTSIQKTLEQNREQLLRQGALYPRAASIAAGGHLNLVWELTSPWKHVEGIGGTRELIQEIETASPSHVIISAESFSGFRRRDDVLALPRVIAEELGAEVQIVATVRPQFLLLDSLYAQNASTGYTSSTYAAWIMNQLAEDNVDLEALLGRWFDEYEEVSLLVVEKNSSSLAEELLSMCGVEIPEGLTTAPRANVRTTTRAVEYGRVATEIMSRSGFPPEIRHAVIRELKRSVIEGHPDDPSFSGMSHEIAAFVHEFFAPRNESFFAARSSSDPGFITSPSDYTFKVNQMDLEARGSRARMNFEVLLATAFRKVLSSRG